MIFSEITNAAQIPKGTQPTREGEGERFVAVLEIPAVDSAVTAVRVQIVKDVKEGRAK